MPYDHKYTETLDKDFGRDAFNPQWEFGFGLSYSTFSYSNLSVAKKSYGIGDTLDVSVDVTNTSEIEGREVVEIFVTDRVASITPSVKRLRGFRKIFVEAGEKATVVIQIPIDELGFVNKDAVHVVEAGDFQLSVDNLTADFRVE